MPENNLYPRSIGRQIQQQAILYDLDYSGRQAIIRSDLTILDSLNNIPTPTPALYQARFKYGELAQAIPRRKINPRQCICYFEHEDIVTERTVYNPYNPSNSNFIELINQLENWQGVSCISYRGEAVIKGLENLI
jgi:hypothetical protein